MDNDTVFKLMASMIVAGIVFIFTTVPLLIEEPNPEQDPETKSLKINYNIPEFNVPDVSYAFEVKANYEAAKSRIDEVSSLMARFDEIEPKLIKLTYAGTFYVTMYAATVEQCGNDLGITASGKKVTEDPSCRTVAVDPAVIPLGTKLIIEGYDGIIWEAADTGSAINGYDLDLFTSSEQESKSFNPVYLEAWIVEEI